MARLKLLMDVILGVNCWCLCPTCMGGAHCYNKGSSCLM